MCGERGNGEELKRCRKVMIVVGYLDLAIDGKGFSGSFGSWDGSSSLKQGSSRVPWDPVNEGCTGLRTSMRLNRAQKESLFG